MDLTGHSVDSGVPRRGLPSMMLMAIATGVIAGLGAWGFRVLIGFVHNVMFLREFSSAHDANAHTPPSPWGMGVALALFGRLLTLLFGAEPRSTVRTSPRIWLNDEADDSVAHGWQSWLRRWPVDFFFPASLL